MKQLVLLSLSAIIAFSACKKKDDPVTPATPKAKVMFGNAFVNTDTLKVNVDNASQASVPGLTFLSHSGYVDVETGSRKISFISAFAGTSLKDTTLNLTGNSYYSIFATGFLSSPSIVVVNDDLSTPASGNAKFRVINLSPDNLHEGIYIDGNPTAVESNITYKLASPFVQISAGTHTVTVGDPSNFTSSISVSPVPTFAVGKIYTIIVTGTQGATGSGARKLTMISNN